MYFAVVLRFHICKADC